MWPKMTRTTRAVVMLAQATAAAAFAPRSVGPGLCAAPRSTCARGSRCTGITAFCMRARIALVQTGGTIDKDYPRSTLGYAFEIDEPATERIIADAAHVPLSVDFDCRTVCRKDSTEITDADREDIVELCSNLSTDKIVVTHGTDTMIETAKYLAKDSRLGRKTVVLTGAMRPQRFRESDAPFNVGLAVGAVQALSPGVYVAMCGAVFAHDRCRRDLESGSFVALAPFSVNDKVFVEEPIESDFEDCPDLSRGMVGRVITIDEEGDAYIDFEASVGKQWVSSAQHGKLTRFEGDLHKFDLFPSD